MTMQQLYLLVPLAPLAAAAIVGLFGPKLGRSLSHWLCILGVAVAFVASLVRLAGRRAPATCSTATSTPGCSRGTSGSPSAS